jgi:hypothetical protein
MLDSELDKVRHHSHPDWNDNDSDFDTLIKQLDNGVGEAGPFVDEDDENVGLVTGVAELRHSFYLNIEISCDGAS